MVCNSNTPLRHFLFGLPLGRGFDPLLKQLNILEV